MLEVGGVDLIAYDGNREAVTLAAGENVGHEEHVQVVDRVVAVVVGREQQQPAAVNAHVASVEALQAKRLDV